MSRPVILLSLATLSLFVACVDLRLPSKVSQCEKNDNCVDRTDGGTGGKGGASAGAGGSRPMDAGWDAPMAGRGGSGGKGGTSGGNTTGGSGGMGGTGGAVTGGTGGSSSTGTEPAPDASIDEMVSKGDVPEVFDVSFDTLLPEADGPEPAPDVALDLPPDRPDTGFDSLTCIQSFKANHYTLSVPADGGPKGCSECANGSPMEGACKAMIDCLVGVWVCRPSSGAGCWRDCRNYVGGDMVLDTCVSALVTKACP